MLDLYSYSQVKASPVRHRFECIGEGRVFAVWIRFKSTHDTSRWLRTETLTSDFRGERVMALRQQASAKADPFGSGTEIFSRGSDS